MRRSNLPTKNQKAAPTRPKLQRRRLPSEKATGKLKLRRDGVTPTKSMLIGYARVSTLDQNLALQRDALAEAGCGRVFIEQMSGAVLDRPALREALDFARAGDTIVVWKLDRLARSMKQLNETIEILRLRNIGFRSLTENPSIRRPRRACLSFTCSALWQNSNAP